MSCFTNSLLLYCRFVGHSVFNCGLMKSSLIIVDFNNDMPFFLQRLLDVEKGFSIQEVIHFIICHLLWSFRGEQMIWPLQMVLLSL